jgi:hypothetical protein
MRPRNDGITEITPDWLDWVVVERVLTGEDPGRRPTTAEQRDIARHLVIQGHGHTAVAQTLGLNGAVAKALVSSLLAGEVAA